MTRDVHAMIEFICSREKVPFEWGSDKNDCVSFAAGALKALTGRDVLAEIGLTWSTEAEATAALAGKGGLEAAIDSVLTPIHPAFAQRGDIAGLITPDGQLLLAVFLGEQVIGPEARGNRRRARSLVQKAWSAG